MYRIINTLKRFTRLIYFDIYIYSDIPETSLSEAGAVVCSHPKASAKVLRLGAEGRQAVGIDHHRTGRHLPLDALAHGRLVIAASLKRCFNPAAGSLGLCLKESQEKPWRNHGSKQHRFSFPLVPTNILLPTLHSHQQATIQVSFQ